MRRGGGGWVVVGGGGGGGGGLLRGLRSFPTVRAKPQQPPHKLDGRQAGLLIIR